MRALVLLFAAACAVSATTTKRENVFQFYPISGSPIYDSKPCDNNIDVTLDYLESLYDFATKSFKTVGRRSDFYFVYSPMALWIITATIAEGADRVIQQEMFKHLGLPNDICLRMKYYQLATSRIWPGDDVRVTDTRTLVIDEDLRVNLNWYNFVKNNHLIDVVSAPIRRRPDVAIAEMQRVVGGSLHSYNLLGNSVILDAMDYDGLWATTFHDAVLERAPFYNQTGSKIGSIDLMRVKRKIRMAHMAKYNLKVMELPVGIGNRYRMIFAVILDDADVHAIVDLFQKSIVLEFLEAAEESHITLDVAIPRLKLTSEIDARAILEDMGVSSPWSEAGATRFISSPPALPSSFVQRVSMAFDDKGLGPPELVPRPPSDTPTGLTSVLGREFVADRPFLFGLFDAETYSPLIASVYSQPTYTD